MNEPVEHLRGLLDEVGLVRVVVQLVVGLKVKDHVQSLEAFIIYIHIMIYMNELNMYNK